MSLLAVKKKLLMAQKGGADISELFNTSLWTGTSAARTITSGIDSGGGSLVWIKARSTSTEHNLFDTVRGAGYILASSSTSFQALDTNRLSSFGSTGYSLGSSTQINFSGTTYVGWQFCRAEKFFDIVQYTGNGVAGRTITHNLGVKPGMVVVKRVDATVDWQVYHQAQGATKYGVLNSTAPFAAATNRWNDAEPAASVFTVGNDVTVNASGGTYIAYLFAHDPSPEGLIQCGQFTLNGSGAATVDLGWKPQFLMMKSSSIGVDNWSMHDLTRGWDDSVRRTLNANLAAAESSAAQTPYVVKPTPSGFEIQINLAPYPGSSHVYMAIREAA